MSRIIKYVVWLVGGFVALFAIAAIALYLFFDPNDFREDISTSVRNQTGRELTIDGEISLDVFPWLAIEVGKTSLGNAPGYGDEPMASFERASFSVRLMPVILRREIVIGAADIESLRLNLQVDAHGNDNWSDLVAEESNDANDDAPGSAGGININSIEIVNAMISYTDAGSGDVVVIDEANLRIGRLTDDGSAVPVDAELNFDVQPAGLVGTVRLKTSMAFDAGAGRLQLDDVSIDGSVEGVASIPTGIKVTTDGVLVSMKRSEIAVEPIDLALLDMRITAALQPFSYADDLTIRAQVAVAEFSPRSVMHLFDVESPKTVDPAVLSSASLNADVEFTPTVIELTKVSLKLDDSTFGGTLSVPRAAAGFYKFDLTGDAIDLNRYMEPATAGGGSAESAPVEIPTDLIASLNARGKFELDAATLGNIVFENLSVGVNSGGGRMRIFPIASNLFGGSYKGDVRIDVSGTTTQLSMNENVEGVDLARLAKAMFDQDNVTGTISGAFKLAGTGRDLMAIQRDLSGDMSLQLNDGTYEGTDIWYELRRARAVLKGEQAPQPVLPARTAFSTVRVSGVVTDGVMNSDDLFAELPYMQISGGGKVDLAAATVDYRLTARVLERPEFLRDATPEELDEFTEAVIPLRITGPIASPSVRPDVEKLLRQRVEDEIEDLLKDKLKDLFD